MYLIPSFLLAETMSAIARSSALLAPKLLKTAPAVGAQTRNLNLLEYQSKGLLENYGVTVQKFKMAGNADEVPQEYGASVSKRMMPICFSKCLLNMKPCLSDNLNHRLRRFPSRSHVRNMSSRPRFWLEVAARVILTTASR